MESHEVLRTAIRGRAGVKEVASGLGLSSSLVYKWCEPSNGDSAAGSANPLDRLVSLCRLTRSREPIQWLCEQFGGMFVASPPARRMCSDDLLPATRRILREFSDLLEVITRSAENDNEIDAREAARIRREWENLKRIAEEFVFACEHNVFASAPPRRARGPAAAPAATRRVRAAKRGRG